MHFDGFRQMSITAGTKGSGRLVFDSSGTKGSCRLIFHSNSRGRSKIIIFYSYSPGVVLPHHPGKKSLKGSGHPILPGATRLAAGLIPNCQIEIGQKDRTALHNRPGADVLHQHPPRPALRPGPVNVSVGLLKTSLIVWQPLISERAKRAPYKVITPWKGARRAPPLPYARDPTPKD